MNKKTKNKIPIIIRFELNKNKNNYYNSFEEIKKLPSYNDIVYIDCGYNQLTELPSNLPASLQELNCYDNNLTELPSNLPASLQELDCCDNQLTELPLDLDKLENLYYICYYNNQIEYIPPHIIYFIEKLKSI